MGGGYVVPDAFKLAITGFWIGISRGVLLRGEPPADVGFSSRPWRSINNEGALRTESPSSEITSGEFC